MPTAEEILTIPDPTEALDLKFSKMSTTEITSDTTRITKLPDDFEPDSSLEGYQDFD